MNFANTKQTILDHLRGNYSAISSELNPENIEFGKYGTIPTDAPFIYIFCLPSSSKKTESARRLHKMTVEISCGWSDASADDAMDNALELAENCYDQMAICLQNRIAKADIEFDGIYSNNVVMNISMEVRYERGE